VCVCVVWCGVCVCVWCGVSECVCVCVRVRVQRGMPCAVCCSVLQCGAVCYSVLQCAAASAPDSRRDTYVTRLLCDMTRS